MKKEDNKSKKAKRENPGDNGKEQLRRFKKEGKKVMRDNFDDNEKEKNEKREQQKKKRKA